MADFNAIAATSRTLRRLLVDRMATPGVAVTLVPPDVTVANINGPRLNLYCFQLVEHPQLKNQTIPGREHPAAYGHPPLSLTMRYLMTSHARTDDQPDSDLIAQALLGDAMLVLHDFGSRWDDLLLTTNRIGSIGDPLLDPVLQNEHERMKLTLAPITVDEISKLWSAMPQANLRRAVIYDASVVQIEGRLPRRQPQPVATRRLLVSVARPPRIEWACTTPPPPPAPQVKDQRIAVGEEISIEHAPVVAERLYVRLGNLEPIRVPLPSDGKLRLVLPDIQYAPDPDHSAPRPILPEDRLQPGVLEVVLLAVSRTEGVQGALDRGQPLAQDRALRSNTALLQLVPTIATVTSNGTANDLLTVTGTRLWNADAPSEVIVGDVAIPVRMPRPGDAWAAPTETQVQVPVAPVADILQPRPAPYPVAVQVNGARSRTGGPGFRLDP